METATIDHYLTEFSNGKKSLAGHAVPWLQGMRQKAIDRFPHLGFPTRRNEEWKYTDVTSIEQKRFKPIIEPTQPFIPDEIKAQGFDYESYYTLIFLNGQFSLAATDPRALPEGVTVESLGNILVTDPRQVKKHLARYADANANGFSALNTAFMTDGTYIHLAENIVLDKPIQLLFVSTAQHESSLSQPRNLVVLEEGAQATLIERHVHYGQTADYFTNAITEIVLQKNSVLEHFKLQEESLNSFHVATTQVFQEAGSEYTFHNFSFGALISRNDINVILAAEGAVCTLNGLFMVDGEQHVDNHTRIDHAQPDCTSRELYKGILRGESRGVFNGKIYVHPDAQQTKAFQSNANLLLSDHAEIDTKPQLEIFADNVKCNHGASVGRLDEDAIFFLKSRGLDDSTARDILTFAFANEILQQVTNESLRTWLSQILISKMPDNSRFKEIIQ